MNLNLFLFNVIFKYVEIRFCYIQVFKYELLIGLSDLKVLFLKILQDIFDLEARGIKDFMAWTYQNDSFSDWQYKGNTLFCFLWLLILWNSVLSHRMCNIICGFFSLLGVDKIWASVRGGHPHLFRLLYRRLMGQFFIISDRYVIVASVLEILPRALNKKPTLPFVVYLQFPGLFFDPWLKTRVLL